MNPDEVRLLGYEAKDSNGDIHHVTINYDGSGRISSIATYKNTETPITLFTLGYNANETILVMPPPNDPSLIYRDTIRLIRDAGNRLLKRIQYTYNEFGGSLSSQRTYKYDTINYEYEGTGILKKETHSHKDTTWFNPGVVRTEVLRSSEVTDYTNAGGNVTTKVTKGTTSSVSYQSGNTYLSSRSSELTISFQFKKAYANQTDFSNAAILKELNLFGERPLNKAYTNLPEIITSAYIEKDQNGSVISSWNFTQNVLITYNSYGFVSTVSDGAAPNLQTIFHYNK